MQKLVPKKEKQQQWNLWQWFFCFQNFFIKEIDQNFPEKKQKNGLKFTLDKHISQILCWKNVKKNVREKRTKKKGCYYGPTVQGSWCSRVKKPWN
jgi:hypothetical protein